MQQSSLDMPEVYSTHSYFLHVIHFKVLWKAYIDFEIEEGENERVRILYESLLQRTQHIKV